MNEGNMEKNILQVYTDTVSLLKEIQLTAHMLQTMDNINTFVFGSLLDRLAASALKNMYYINTETKKSG